MIMANMRSYEYYLYDTENNEYGQKVLIKDENGEPKVQGTIKLNINITSQGIQDNINYKNAQYIGLTSNTSINDSFVVKYDDNTKLKVLYVNPLGRLKQVFMGEL